MNLLRRELKFQIPLGLVGPISEFVSMYCDLDYYSSIANDGYYTINSLYFDNDAMVLVERKRQDVANRYSMRLRSYGQQPTFPAFIEVKEKANQWVHKRRAPITSLKTVEFFRDGTGGSGNPDIENPYIREVANKILMRGLKPKLMTQYERKAYFGRFEKYTRVTFDRRMRCYPEEEYNIFPDARKFANYDHDWQYVDLRSSVVLELKCEARVPKWMFDLVRQFELNQLQFSKYDSAWTYASQDDLEFKTDVFDRVSAFSY